MEKNAKHKIPNGNIKTSGTSSDNYETEKGLTTCCLCIRASKSQRKGLIAGFVTNLGIFAILFTYTLLGAFLFLALEGNGTRMYTQTLATTSYQAIKHEPAPLTDLNGTITHLTSELRSQTVESIWEITVSLNILYKENWTRLAAQEIARFQEKLVAKVAADVSAQYGPSSGVRAMESAPNLMIEDYEWNFPRAFLYSLTVLTTIGYGSVTPKTAAGKAVTIGYAVVGIPLTLLYLSVVGALLSRVVRGIFNNAICVCLCSKCGFCCFNKQINANSKEKNKNKDDYKLSSVYLQEPYYVRSQSGTIISAAQAQSAGTSSSKDKKFLKDCDSESYTDSEVKVSLQGLTILAPISLCLFALFMYVFFGAFILYKLEGWDPIDGIYFCFMSLSTIGFGHVGPGVTHGNSASNSTIWFCCLYIFIGLALTAMCFNVLHDEILHRLRYHEKKAKDKLSKILSQRPSPSPSLSPEFRRGS